MKKMLKIIFSIFVVIIIIISAFAAIIFLDLASYTATGSKILEATGNSVGKALVVYDPGLSGTSKVIADKIASNLQTESYTVTLSGIKSSAAANVTGYSIVVVGGPIYAGSPTASVKNFLGNLQPGYAIPNGPYSFIRVGVFGIGQGTTTPDDVAAIKNAVPVLSKGTLSSTVIVKIGQNEDLNARAQDFVVQLTN
jgi:flavodoxin